MKCYYSIILIPGWNIKNEYIHTKKIGETEDNLHGFIMRCGEGNEKRK